MPSYDADVKSYPRVNIFALNRSTISSDQFINNSDFVNDSILTPYFPWSSIYPTVHGTPNQMQAVVKVRKRLVIGIGFLGFSSKLGIVLPDSNDSPKLSNISVTHAVNAGFATNLNWYEESSFETGILVGIPINHKTGLSTGALYRINSGWSGHMEEDLLGINYRRTEIVYPVSLKLRINPRLLMNFEMVYPQSLNKEYQYWHHLIGADNRVEYQMEFEPRPNVQFRIGVLISAK